MQQATKILAMSTLELEQTIQQKIDTNPMLERVDSDEDISDMDADDILSLDEWTKDDPDVSLREDEGFEPTMELEDFAWDDVYVPETQDTSQEDAEYGAPIQKLVDYVRWQMNLKNLSQIDVMICEYLLDGMDEEGFIRLDLDELHQSFAMHADFFEWESRIDMDEILGVLRRIQSCAPLGVGARSLDECLRIQLDALPPNTPYLEEARAILDAKDDLIGNHIKRLVNKTGIDIQDIEPALNLIRTLNQSPAADYQQEVDHEFFAQSAQIPDILLTPKGQGFLVRLNPEVLPKVQLNETYAALIDAKMPENDQVYLKTHLADAKLFIRAIEERNQNLLKVAIALVRVQRDFFDSGDDRTMKPLTLAQIADEVGLHESTVSRLTTNKTLLAPSGLFDLKYFFSSHVQGAGVKVSSTAICAMISDIIEQEDPKKPVSDSAICRTLQTQGIDIARRTVTKYRENLMLPSASARKKRY